MCVLGMDGLRYLNSADQIEVTMMEEVARRALRIMETLDHNRAVDIANQVGKMLGA